MVIVRSLLCTPKPYGRDHSLQEVTVHTAASVVDGVGNGVVVVEVVVVVDVVGTAVVVV